MTRALLAALAAVLLTATAVRAVEPSRVYMPLVQAVPGMSAEASPAVPVTTPTPDAPNVDK